MEQLPGRGHGQAVRDRAGADHSDGERNLTFLQLVGGFIYLLMGADLLVRGSVALARLLRVPGVVVAATVVGFGTSLPELVVSVQASVTGYPNLILGNVVGSNIANVLLVAGVSAVVYPMLSDDRAVRGNVMIMAGSLLLFAAMAVTQLLSRPGGVLLLGAFVVMITWTTRTSLRDRKDQDLSIPLDWVLGLPTRPWLIGLFILFGVVMLPLGAYLLVDSAVEIAAAFEVPETVVGLTVLAIGTSLPELTTTVLAAMERRADVAIGAVVGSNTFNVLAIMGVTAAMSPVPVPVSTRFVFYDVPVMLVTSAVLGYFAWTSKPIGRGVGITMLLAYLGYLGTLYVLV